ncbi:nicotinate phosphoribosyltransferase, putative [Perkinsus marinus ATCC 50983]|uniref:nicotinate phosphoribosyltransferase n=1 Tax=Perkinsus marinus (strain ATCC 50983 / TXsc) TaxID=423536 RepID=C5K9Q3_PERM5|nr:nicotinate phosphoribosyltransferase, putative [Perkinsus marinus ATCC 50983]EER18825.1 nicotinate phosphoribosyltransferase, putative [Perkinsus marinus ATCC 50983]|eukprot:XP_002787029.1 nicotinate phosphoribosyltransferase, putative [Perkinsus marinus ATCC 50983]
MSQPTSSSQCGTLLEIPGLKGDRESQGEREEEDCHKERSSSYIARGYAACESPSDGHAFSRCRCDSDMGEPHSDIIEATFTDLYQITMAYAYWKSGKDKDHAVFDVYFRKCPFGGEFTVCAGIDEVVRYVNTFRFTQLHIDYLQSQMPEADPEFFQYLLTLDARDITMHAVREGDFVFPREPVLRVAGPLIVCQLMETAILNLVNFPCLVATQAARLRIAAGDEAQLLEFGARRAQGPDGALTASRYSYVGGFDGTSNVKAGHVFGIPIAGTHAHAFVNSFYSLEDLEEQTRMSPELMRCYRLSGGEWEWRLSGLRVNLQVNCCNDGELAAFIRYAQAFPTTFLALVDTYETILSGVPNYLSVALALWRIAGIKAVGIRLDSGDLAYLSMRAREVFSATADAYASEGFQFIAKSRIVASNDINEAVLLSLHDQPHSIDSFGIGTNLVTCQAQPALGMVYKLVELNGQPRMKLSQDFEKQGIPSRKAVYRLYGQDGLAILDIMQGEEEPAPQPDNKVFCRHLFDDQKRCYVTPKKVEPLLICVWKDGKAIHLTSSPRTKENDRPDIHSAKEHFKETRNTFRKDHLRPINPTPYKVSTSAEFFDFFRRFWQETAPVKEFS